MSPIKARLVDLFDAWLFAARKAELAFATWASSPSTERAGRACRHLGRARSRGARGRGAAAAAAL
jgi:hypothetical protein